MSNSLNNAALAEEQWEEKGGPLEILKGIEDDRPWVNVNSKSYRSGRIFVGVKRSSAQPNRSKRLLSSSEDQKSRNRISSFNQSQSVL